MGAQSQNIGLHVGAFVLAWTAGSMYLAAILSPHWTEAVNSQSEAVTSMRHTHGLLERCSYLPTGQIECYPIYDHSYQWAGAMKGMMFASFGLMVLASFAILAGGNCTGIAYKELFEVQSSKLTALLAGGIASGIAMILSMVTLILMSIQVSERTMFASSLVGQVSGNDGISDSYDIIVYKGSSFILAASGCGLSGLVAILGVYANIAGKKVGGGENSPIDQGYERNQGYDDRAYNPYDYKDELKGQAQGQPLVDDYI